MGEIVIQSAAGGGPITLDADDVPRHPGIALTHCGQFTRRVVTHRKSGLAMGMYAVEHADMAACVAAAFDADPSLVADIDAAIPDDHVPGLALPPGAFPDGLRLRLYRVRVAYDAAIREDRARRLGGQEYLIEVDIVRRTSCVISVVSSSLQSAMATALRVDADSLASRHTFDWDSEIEYPRQAQTGDLPEETYDAKGRRIDA